MKYGDPHGAVLLLADSLKQKDIKRIYIAIQK